MATAREEAAPTFESWKLRLEGAAADQLQPELEQFLRVLNTLGTPLIDGAKVHFVYYDPAAVNVAVAGEFNEWARNNDAVPMQRLGDTGLFFHTLIVPGATRLEYKFLVDGEWKIDPLCQQKVDNGIGGENTFFVVGDFHDPPELERVAEAAHGRVEEFEFESERLRNKRGVYVYLPAAYDHDRDARFPSFYVHDGGEYLERARMSNVLDNLIHAQQIAPIVVVMIDPVNRMREYAADAAYRDFLCDEFIPAIEDRYRTISHRDSRGVMGASLGGLISTYLALSRPQLFSKVAGQSSALHYQEDKLVSLLDAAADTTIRFYLDVGTYEPRFIPAHERFVAVLRQKRWPCFYQELPGGHNWTNWRAHLKDLLTYLWSKQSP
jgi:enterochelin esterase-like enzyme